MLFNSIEFIIFLPIVFILYWFILKPLKWQNLLIVIASYIFYGWWNWKFLILIAFTTLCSYLSGILLERYNNSKTYKRFICGSNIFLNLAILAYFKYCNFFGENFTILLNKLGFNVDWITLDILLPVGISFYTFQALSYTIDVYRKKILPTHDVIAFFAFISFFPQLVAGPIERATNLLPQFLKPRTFNYALAVDGMRQILWGAFKKIIIADNCAIAVNEYFGNYQHYDGFNLFLGAVFFTFQIYGDFSGYSDMAIGTARLFGMDLMRNFNFPYFSRDIAEFWRRWHISLTTWFRDYIYIPLGGSRCNKWKVARNTLIIFLVSGLWHGANWTFICWGIYHAILFFPLFILNKNRKYTDIVAKGKIFPSMKELCQIIITFLLVVIGWILFRAENITQAWNYIYHLITTFHVSPIAIGRRNLLFILVLLSVEWLQRGKQHGLQISEDGILSFRIIRWSLYYILIGIILLYAGNHSNFIYFQF